MSRRNNKNIPFGADIFLSVLEGIEGGFAMFVGIVAGLYFQNVSHDLLISVGVISMVVNAFCSSSVRYMSTHYNDELDGHEKRNKFHAYFLPALVEFVTYTFASLIAVIPLLVIRDSFLAITFTIFLTTTIVFAAGAYRGSLLGRHALRDGIELASISLAIILVGTSVGWIVAQIVS